jgi:hypothetical protein
MLLIPWYTSITSLATEAGSVQYSRSYLLIERFYFSAATRWHAAFHRNE